MAVHIDLGRQGEQMAEAYLIARGFTILHRNWRHSHYEIDLIALKNELPHFVEVKFRSSNKFGMPEENVTKKKIKFLLQAADEFLFRNQQYKNFHIDILSITTHADAETEYFFIEDVYL
jgi:putative endonuclease